MARLFPLRSETETSEGQPRVVDLEGEDADAVFAALSSTTAREIYGRLNDEPGTPSDVAEAIDSSIQNVRYHLGKLEDAGLVEVVDTWYSSRGNEMSVYATTNGPLIVTSDKSRADRLKEVLSRFLGGIAALAGGSLLVQHAAGRFFGATDDVEVVTTGDSGDGGSTGSGGDDAGSTADSDDEEPTADADDEEPTADAEENGEESGAFEEGDEADEASGTSDASDGDDPNVTGDDLNVTGDEVGLVDSPDALETATTLPPGLLFFLGGLFVLTIVVAYWYWSTRRPVR